MVNEGLTMQTVLIGEEKNKVLVFDDFLTSPSELVEFAESSTFIPYPAAVQRKGYPGVRTPAPVDYGDHLRKGVGELVRQEFGISTDAKIKTFQEALCLMTVQEAELGPLQTIPHFDASDPNFFAVLLYLCGDEHGGTAFYQHNSTHYESITPERCDNYLDSCYEELNSKKREKRYFSDSDELFTKIGFMPVRFNRLVIYRGCLLHSANILSDISINSNPAVGRLTANIFLSFE